MTGVDRRDQKAWRWRTPTRLGRWRPTIRDAQLDAVKAGFGSVEGWPDAPVYLHPLVEIERRDA